MKKGFTLVELLVVIAIIGILSSVVITSLGTAREKARDSKRIQDLAQIKNALELYRDDNGHYPIVGNSYYYSYNSSWNTFTSVLSPYLSDVPVDPVNVSTPPWSNNGHSYAYGRTGTNGNFYNLVTQFENDEHRLRCELKNYFFYGSENDDPALYWCVNNSNRASMYVGGISF